MSNDESGSGASTQGRPVGQRLKRGLESKVLVPLATTVVSAAASYLLRKLPMIIEERVLPKLREQGAADTVRDAVASVTEQAAEVVPGVGGKSAGDDPASSGAASGDGDGNGAMPSPTNERRLSNQEREKERRAREERRRERKR